MCDRLFRYGVTLCCAVLVAICVTAAAKAGTYPSPSDSIPNLNEVDLNGNSAN